MKVELNESQVRSIRRYDEIVSAGISDCDKEELKDLQMSIANFMAGRVYAQDSYEKAKAAHNAQT